MRHAIAQRLAAPVLAVGLSLIAGGLVAESHAIEGRMVDLGGKSLFHVSVGEGTPIIVLHGGLGLDHTYFRPVLDEWAAFAELHYYDHEGNGRSSAPEDYGTITLDTMAEDVFAMADALGLEEFVLFGHSYGGFIAQVAAQKQPGRLKGLILSNTSPRLGYDVVFPDWAPAEAQAAVGKLFSEPMSDDAIWAETWKTALPAYWKTPDPEMLEAVHDSTHYKSAAIRNALGLLADYNVTEALSSLEMPVLVLAGRDDFVTPAVAHEDIHAALPNSTLVIFEESGHYPFITEQAAYTETVRDWLAGL